MKAMMCGVKFDRGFFSPASYHEQLLIDVYCLALSRLMTFYNATGSYSEALCIEKIFHLQFEKHYTTIDIVSTLVHSVQIDQLVCGFS